MSQSDDPQDESLLAYAARIKMADRLRLWQLDPQQAQAEVDRVLSPAKWQVSDPSQLLWQGDLGDEPDDPDWMTAP